MKATVLLNSDNRAGKHLVDSKHPMAAQERDLDGQAGVREAQQAPRGSVTELQAQ